MGNNVDGMKCHLSNLFFCATYLIFDALMHVSFTM